ncbi:tyrosine-type recombinase/integrase [Hathewaya limosa]|uniref:Site-specific recombinase XerD n=1 Tax=Hathewaya limosa TaxID=1536 RepID=A0ABU0JSU5_HATLI|nr:tyrosine-type recombinase/integrase [Hathewaya limosa]AWZ48641.1 integrase [Clostridiaceae bacterium 14S0207]MDQ0480163.1 site-specific recombinase XerD [Hathewaya limosa]
MDIVSVNEEKISILKEKPHFIEYFLKIKALKSKNTSKSYERDIKDFFGVENIKSISIDQVRCVNFLHAEQYILELKNKGYASATINRKVSSLSALYRWLLKYRDNVRDIQIIKYNPFAELGDEKPTVVNKETEFLTKEECVKLLESIDIDTLIGLRDKCILSLALTTALRKSEIINIQLKDIKKYADFDVIEVRRKGGKKDLVKLQDGVKELILTYLEKTQRNLKTNSEEYLFMGHSTNGLNGKKLNRNTLNLIIDRTRKKAGIDKKLQVHSTRHTAITLVIQSGATLEKVRDFAAHANISTTNRYIHSIDKLKNNPGDLIDIL